MQEVNSSHRFKLHGPKLHKSQPLCSTQTRLTSQRQLQIQQGSPSNKWAKFQMLPNSKVCKLKQSFKSWVTLQEPTQNTLIEWLREIPGPKPQRLADLASQKDSSKSKVLSHRSVPTCWENSEAIAFPHQKSRQLQLTRCRTDGSDYSSWETGIVRIELTKRRVRAFNQVMTLSSASTRAID